MAIAFTVALVFALIQLEVMDLFPHERGAAASLGTFFGLILNAVLAGAVAPLVSTSLIALALTAMGFAVLGWAFWTWHRRAVRPTFERGGRRRAVSVPRPPLETTKIHHSVDPLALQVF